MGRERPIDAWRSPPWTIGRRVGPSGREQVIRSSVGQRIVRSHGGPVGRRRRVPRPCPGHAAAADRVRDQGVCDRLVHGHGWRRRRPGLPAAEEPDRMDLLRPRPGGWGPRVRHRVRAVGARRPGRGPAGRDLRGVAGGVDMDPPDHRRRDRRGDLPGWPVPVRRMAQGDVGGDRDQPRAYDTERPDPSPHGVRRGRQPARHRRPARSGRGRGLHDADASHRVGGCGIDSCTGSGAPAARNDSS